jgi:16S rRNA (guanine527-N7)-methyltransferase
MTCTENKKILTDTLIAFGIPDAEKKANLMLGYMKLVLKQNEVMNLTAITDEDEFIARHMLDSLAVLGRPELECAKRVADVGTGAGFPGVPLAIAYPDKDFLLIDSLRKRTDFIAEACAGLGIKNVRTRHARAEDAARIDTIGGKDTKRQPSYATDSANSGSHTPRRETKRTASAEKPSEAYHSTLRESTLRESFDLAVCRAVGHLAVLCEYCLPLVRVGGAVYAYKSESQTKEAAESIKALSTLGASAEVEIVSANECLGPAHSDSENERPGPTHSNSEKEPKITQGSRHIIMVIQKKRPTPDRYPRRPGVPAKSPL